MGHAGYDSGAISKVWFCLAMIFSVWLACESLPSTAPNYNVTGDGRDWQRHSAVENRQDHQRSIYLAPPANFADQDELSEIKDPYTLYQEMRELVIDVVSELQEKFANLLFGFERRAKDKILNNTQLRNLAASIVRLVDNNLVFNADRIKRFSLSSVANNIPVISELVQTVKQIVQNLIPRLAEVLQLLIGWLTNPVGNVINLLIPIVNHFFNSFQGNADSVTA